MKVRIGTGLRAAPMMMLKMRSVIPAAIPAGQKGSLQQILSMRLGHDPDRHRRPERILQPKRHGQRQGGGCRSEKLQEIQDAWGFI
ncbi:hypothetical protein [Paracoccus sp. S3-43]|uniref:hypothetical protein n=1 Tax=Paracoccus sp. S3-43 TaxID=3030011 RepID=UPI0023B1DFF2|nr:hypothetical protein [Paracoccus sp. S3-43]WEF24160.1 hypothetical protein PXD02_15480 [Paracoccus sp. S3-43]